METILFTRKRLISIVIIAVCMVSIVTFRLLLDQWQGYATGMENLKTGDYKTAIMHFDRTLNAHIPFSPLEQTAKYEVLKLAAKYEAADQYELALLCYETVRTSRYLARHFWVPDNDEIPAWNDKIARIKAALLLRDGMATDFRTGYDQQMALLDQDHSPSVFWSLIVVISFWAYIGLIVLWIFRRKKLYIPVIVLSFLTWLVALYFA